MKLCPKCSPRDARAALCDFCKHFEHETREEYYGEGDCVHPKHPGPRDLDESCEDFHCGMADGGKR